MSLAQAFSAVAQRWSRQCNVLAGTIGRGREESRSYSGGLPCGVQGGRRCGRCGISEVSVQCGRLLLAVVAVTTTRARPGGGDALLDPVLDRPGMRAVTSEVLRGE